MMIRAVVTACHLHILRHIRDATVGRSLWSCATVLALLLASLAGALVPVVCAVANGAPASFRVDPEQRKNLGFTVVRPMALHDEVYAEGKIALDADHVTPVHAQLSGAVLRVYASPGDHVQVGSPLLLMSAVEIAQARTDLRAALGSVASAHAQQELAETGAERRKALYEAKVGSLQDWQQSQNDLAQARAAVAAAEGAVRLARSRLGILGQSAQDIEAWLAHPDASDAATAVVRAPIAGTVSDRQVGVGEFVQPGGATPLFSISDLSRVWLLAYVRESDAAALRVGQRIDVQVAALPGKAFTARVRQVAPVLDPATHRLLVRAELPNPGEVLKPEMFANFRIATSGDRAVLAIPEAAIVRDGASSRVWVESTPGLLTVREIRTGRRSRGLVEVLEGLRAGETLVTRGTLFIDRAAGGD